MNMKKKCLLFLVNIISTAVFLTGCVSAEKKGDGEVSPADYQTDPYINIQYANVDDVKETADNVRLVLNGKTGTFRIDAVDEMKRNVPVLSTGDSGSSSYFVIRKGKKEYKLDLKSGITPSCRKTEDSCQFVYPIMNTAQVVLDLKPLSSVADGKKDMVEVTLYVTNLTSKDDVFSCKALFDTVLGEGLKKHFETKNFKSITSEKQFSDFSKEKWIKSGDGETSVQFILAGKGISMPEFVTVANRDFLSRSNWIPTAVDSRSFNSVLSLNNSALCLNWPDFNLAPKETKSIRFYIAVGSNGLEPGGNVFLSFLGEEDSVPESTAEKVTEKKTEAKTYADEGGDDIIISPDEITEEQLDSEYIQDLLNRIDSFVAEDGKDEVELKRLNAELDAILEKLGMN